MKRFLVSISGRSNLGSKGCKLRDHEICCAYVHGKSKAEAISKFWEQLEKNPLISRFYTRRDFKIEAERWESDQLSFNGEPLGDWESALPFDQLACAVWNNKTNKLESAEIINKNLKAEMLNEMAQADQAKAERIHDQILETAQESNSEAQKASSAVRFVKISDFEIIARWKGEMIGKITISYKSYTPVSKIYRVNGNIDEKFETLDDAKMHLIQNFRAQAQEALDQIEDEKLMLRNKIDALDDQIAELFIKGAEMRTGKEA